MKHVDDYNAKFELWAREGKVVPLPRCSGLPSFGSKKFDTYEQFNAWKRKLIESVAAMGGVKWTS